MVPNIPENHPNMQALLSELKMEAVEFSVCADVKCVSSFSIFEYYALIWNILQ